MRTSSMKALVITIAILAALTTTMPAAARPAQTTDPVASAPQLRETFAMFKRLYKRFITPVLNGLPVVPIPDDDSSTKQG